MTLSLFRRGFIQLRAGTWQTAGMDRWHWSLGLERVGRKGLGFNLSFHVPLFTMWFYWTVTK